MHYGSEDRQSLFESIKPIMNAIDKIISMDLNEIEKFALAYMVLKGQFIKDEDIAEIKEKKLFQLDTDSDISYLLKQIDSTFNNSVLEFMRKQIHIQSGIPDFDSPEFSAQTGVALKYKLIGFENIASEIEADFKKGEQEAINLINSILYRQTKWDKIKFWKAKPDTKIEIVMSRNLPEDVLNRMEIAVKMKDIGLSDKSIIEYCPMIKNADDEIKRKEEQQEKDLEMFKQMEELKVKEETEPVPPEDVLEGLKKVS